MGSAVAYVLSKVPRPGAVKTRLCPPLTPIQAARAAEAFATDTLAGLAGVGGLEARLALDFGSFPAEQAADEGSRGASRARSSLETTARGLGIMVEDQGGGDLGARMARVLGRGLSAGGPALILGGDVPDLPTDRIRSALAGLSRADVVLVPALDGGYVLVGARRPLPCLFEIDADWGGTGVFDATCRALFRHGASLEVLEAWEDVDDAAALGRLADRLDRARVGEAVETRRLMAQWREEGVRF